MPTGRNRLLAQIKLFVAISFAMFIIGNLYAVLRGHVFLCEGLQSCTKNGELLSLNESILRIFYTALISFGFGIFALVVWKGK